MGKVIDLYGGKDACTVPRYAVGEAALYLRLPRATLKTWVHGRVDQNGRQSRVGIVHKTAPNYLNLCGRGESNSHNITITRT